MATPAQFTHLADSGDYYLTKLNFEKTQGTYYWPSSAYPHLHTGIQAVYYGSEEVTVDRIDSRTGQVKSRTGIQTYGYQTLAFMSYHLPNNPRATHIWSPDRGWNADIDRVVDDLRAVGLLATCKQVLNAFAITRESIPDQLKFT